MNTNQATYFGKRENYHEQRTVRWGNWGITFYNPQVENDKNYGILIAKIEFPCGPQGPIDSPNQKYRDMCKAWVENGVIPSEAVLVKS